MRKIKCPHCNWVRSVPTSEIGNKSIASIVREGERIKVLAEKIRSMLADLQLDEANAWIDLICPNCENSYQYNVRTRKTRP